MQISVCIITYKRPQGLKRLLQGLNRLTFSQVAKPNIEVVVVDNDISGIAEQVCKDIRANFHWSLKTDVESQRGITYARNKSMACASADSDFIAIIDDDEVPEPSWLDELLFVQQKYNADVVTGPVLPHFQEQNIPEWVIKGGFFNKPRHNTGDELHVAFTNNVLVSTTILRQFDPIFDNRFAITGGEDTDFFMRVRERGYKIVWADKALVYDWIPQSRTNVRWILQRGYRGWATYSLLEKELYPSLKVQAVRMMKGLFLISIGVAKFVPALLRGKHARVNSLLYIFRGMGTLAGLLGVKYQEYKNVHSDVGLTQ